MSRSTWLLLSAKEWTDSANSELEPVMRKATNLLIAMATFAANDAKIAPLPSLADICYLWPTRFVHGCPNSIQDFEANRLKNDAILTVTIGEEVRSKISGKEDVYDRAARHHLEKLFNEHLAANAS